MKHVAFLVMLICLALVFFSCSMKNAQREDAVAEKAQDAGDTLYLAHNLWYGDSNKIEAINFKGFNGMIPIGTLVRDVRIDDREDSLGRDISIIKFTLEDGRKFKLTLKEKYQGNMAHRLSYEELQERTFTDKPPAELVAGLKEQEIENIKRGTIQKGMSKRAVLLSWGYPPLHKTPDLDYRRWFYWRKRTLKIVVEFNEQGTVESSSWYGIGGNANDVIE